MKKPAGTSPKVVVFHCKRLAPPGPMMVLIIQPIFEVELVLHQVPNMIDAAGSAYIALFGLIHILS